MEFQVLCPLLRCKMLTLKNGASGNGGYPMRGMHTNWNVAAARRARQLSLSLFLSVSLVRSSGGAPVFRCSTVLRVFFSFYQKIPISFF